MVFDEWGEVLHADGLVFGWEGFFGLAFCWVMFRGSWSVVRLEFVEYRAFESDTHETWSFIMVNDIWECPLDWKREILISCGSLLRSVKLLNILL